MARKKKILFIGGTTNQTTMMHQIYACLEGDFDCYFSPFYADGILNLMAKAGLLEMSLMGKSAYKTNLEYCRKHGLQCDYRGMMHDYDLVFQCNDVIFPNNLRNKQIILVQEGTLMPKDWRYQLVKRLKLPLYLGDTAMFGLSHAYQYLCVASGGYKEEFISRGVKPERIRVTGIPNFDDAEKYKNNDFPHRDFVLAATSNLRESKRFEDRPAFIQKAKNIAAGRPLIFKLHPRENHERAIREIKQYAPGCPIYTSGKIEEMIANCTELVADFSSVILVAAALNKKVYSEQYTPEKIAKLSPLQNGGTSAHFIASLGRELLQNLANPTQCQQLQHSSRYQPSTVLIQN
ncbi:MAG: hypothetical protein R2830_18895 [Saprospiraceae bacterium]